LKREVIESYKLNGKKSEICNPENLYDCEKTNSNDDINIDNIEIIDNKTILNNENFNNNFDRNIYDNKTPEINNCDNNNFENKIDDLYGLKERELLWDNVEFTIKNNLNDDLNNIKNNDIISENDANDINAYRSIQKNKFN